MVIDRIKTQSEWVRPQHIKFITIPVDDDEEEEDEREMITCNFSERINEWVSEWDNIVIHPLNIFNGHK